MTFTCEHGTVIEAETLPTVPGDYLSDTIFALPDRSFWRVTRSGGLKRMSVAFFGGLLKSEWGTQRGQAVNAYLRNKLDRNGLSVQ